MVNLWVPYASTNGDWSNLSFKTRDELGALSIEELKTCQQLNETNGVEILHEASLATCSR
jgi:hypothetical protein